MSGNGRPARLCDVEEPCVVEQYVIIETPTGPTKQDEMCAVNGCEGGAKASGRTDVEIECRPGGREKRVDDRVVEGISGLTKTSEYNQAVLEIDSNLESAKGVVDVVGAEGNPLVEWNRGIKALIGQ